MPRDKEKIKPDFLEDPQIQEVIADILHPYLSRKEPEIAIQFGVPGDKAEKWREAITFASSQQRYSSSTIGRLTRHRVEFTPKQSSEVFRMYQLVETSPHF